MIPPELGDPLNSKYGVFPVLISIIQSPKAQISAATVIFPILVILSGDKYPCVPVKVAPAVELLSSLLTPKSPILTSPLEFTKILLGLLA
jgi:hypothetical protein